MKESKGEALLKDDSTSVKSSEKELSDVEVRIVEGKPGDEDNPESSLALADAETNSKKQPLKERLHAVDLEASCDELLTLMTHEPLEQNFHLPRSGNQTESSSVIERLRQECNIEIASNQAIHFVDNVAREQKSLIPKDRMSAHKILKELPSDEFFHLLEQSSPEQLQNFLNLLGPSEHGFVRLFKTIFSSLTTVPEEPRGAASIVTWWESRRFVFNLAVGLCGLPTLAIVYLTGLADLGFAISGTIEYGILANICYSAGWICELTARAWWGERARHLGPILFTLGFAFSTLLTLGAGLIMIAIFLLISVVRAM